MPWSDKITIGFPNIPHSQWTIVRDVDQFRQVIEDHLEDIKHVAFDHDLAEEHYPWNGGVTGDGRTGYDCAKILVEHCIDRNIPLPNYSCHSMNPAGRMNILAYLDNYRRHSST
jgi:hypothetical protein